MENLENLSEKVCSTYNNNGFLKKFDSFIDNKKGLALFYGILAIGSYLIFKPLVEDINPSVFEIRDRGLMTIAYFTSIFLIEDSILRGVVKRREKYQRSQDQNQDKNQNQTQKSNI